MEPEPFLFFYRDFIPWGFPGLFTSVLQACPEILFSSYTIGMAFIFALFDGRKGL